MKHLKIVALASLLACLTGLAGAVWAGEPEPTAAVERDLAAESSPASEEITAVEADQAPEAETAEPASEVLPWQGPLDEINGQGPVQAGGCSDVCGTYFAPDHGDCDDVGCMNIGCGAPNGWSPPPACICSCSFCF